MVAGNDEAHRDVSHGLCRQVDGEAVGEDAFAIEVAANEDFVLAGHRGHGRLLVLTDRHVQERRSLRRSRPPW